MRVWYELAGEGERSAAHERIVGTLRECGFELARRADHDRDPGLVFFDGVGGSVLDRVLASSQGGLVRVAAVALPGAILSTGAGWQLLEAGASDVVRSGNDLVAQLTARLHRWRGIDEMVESAEVRRRLAGDGSTWIRTLRRLVEVGRHSSAFGVVMGESGTGKEQAARLVHRVDPSRCAGRFVVVDCTNLSPTLAGSELFGHEKGAFTGATGLRHGAVGAADGGTLFLDEVGELPAELQAQLLRVLQERVYKRVGSNEWLASDFRLVCATNRDLLQEVEAGRFRHDLYHRIAGWTCRLPSLAERRGDIPALVRCFLERLGHGHVELDPAVEGYLLAREYPGNVRELEQVVARICHRHVEPGPITVGALPEELRPTGVTAPLEAPGPEPVAERRSPAGVVEGDWRDPLLGDRVARALASGMSLKDIGRCVEELAIEIVHEAEGSIKRTAMRLGVSERTLMNRLAAARRDGRG